MNLCESKGDSDYELILNVEVLKEFVLFSLFPVRWLEPLFDIIEVPVDMILAQSCLQSERNWNGHPMNGNYMNDSGGDLDTSELLEYLMSAKEDVNTSAKVG